jgi:hypothetical protein
MSLKPQDVVILLKLVARENQQGATGTRGAFESPSWTYHGLAYDLFLSPSEVHAGIHRAAEAGLLIMSKRVPVIRAMEEFLIHGIKYVFPPRRGGMTRGLATSYAGPPLDQLFMKTAEPPPVWPFPEGPTRGTEFSPLYKTVPKAAVRDQKLYEMLVLVDAIRDGRARESELAIMELRKRLGRE